MNPTLEDVASAAGLSRATVSRVINASPRVSPEARAAVDAAVEALGYVPNRAARSLVTRRTDSVALIVREAETRLFSEPFFAGIVRGAGAMLAESGVQMVLSLARSDEDFTRLARYLTARHVDGVLLVSTHGQDPLIRSLADANVPTVIGGRALDADGFSSVDADNLGGATQAVEHLFAKGRKLIATITGPLDMGVGLDRYAGYQQAMTRAGALADESLVTEGDFTQEGGEAAMEGLLEKRPDLDGVFAASDLMAAGALRALTRAGKRVPEDVAVVGFDDSPVAKLTEPLLTSVAQPVEVMGRRMAELLLRQIDGDGERQREVLATALVARSSS
jgi:DNA-binding LacI/PurR family transcriptional regulator